MQWPKLASILIFLLISLDEFLHSSTPPIKLTGMLPIFTLIVEMKKGPTVMQESLARLLSVIDYNIHRSTLPRAINYLLDSVKPAVSSLIGENCALTNLVD